MAQLPAKLINLVFSEEEYTENKDKVLSKGQTVYVIDDDSIVALYLGDGVNTLENLEDILPKKLAQLIEDATHRLVTDTEKSTWNGKQDKLTIDKEATEGSTNPIESNAVYELEQIVNGKVDKTTLELYATIEYVDKLIGDIESVKFVVVDSLPEVGDPATIYLVPHEHSTGDIYDEYVYVEDYGWEKIGNTDIDLSNYTTLDVFNKLKNYVYDTLLPIVEGKADASSLSKVATSGKASDLTTDDDNLLVKQAEKTTWNNKQDALTIDTEVKSGSANVVTSGAVYTAIAELQKEVEADLEDVVKYADENITIVCKL